MTETPKTSLLDRVRAMAKELGLEGEEAEQYVGQHMKRAGWTPKTDWLPPDGKGSESGNSGGGWFKE
jgi:hypothetical protein